LCIYGFKETKPEKVEVLFFKYFLILKAIVTKKEQETGKNQRQTNLRSLETLDPAQHLRRYFPDSAKNDLFLFSLDLAEFCDTSHTIL